MIINNVKPGDIIKERGGKGIEVKKVQLNACSSRGVHINDKFCWDSGAPVVLAKVGKDAEETALGDLNEDFDMGILLTLGDSLFSDKTLKRNLATQGS